MNKDEAIALVRFLVGTGLSREKALSNPAIPEELRSEVEIELEREDNIILEPARYIVNNTGNEDWLRNQDRGAWYYWPTLRNQLLLKLPQPAVHSLDEITDKIVGYFAPPTAEEFNIRGLVLGYVQSGKTTNFTATIAKAADSGYHLVIVLSGIDKGLRKQTQVRLEKDLVGVPGNPPDFVPFPPSGREWHNWTTRELDGDFRSGSADTSTLRGSQPVIMVVKKNAAVLRRLLTWLEGAPDEIKRTLPTLIIDDEADLASIDTRGSRQTENDPLPEEYEEPSVINGLIRDLLNEFQKKVYVAYTATPFANILIPHDTSDPRKKNDLFPKDFIVDLPKPDGYFGAEELFGITNPAPGEHTLGLNVIREVTLGDELMLEKKQIPPSLEKAILGFVVAGAARAQRGKEKSPATMLVHLSQYIEYHTNLTDMVKQKFSEFKDSWRYQKDNGMLDKLKDIWDNEYRPIIKVTHPEKDVEFDKIEPYIGQFFESVQIRTVNSFAGEILDYEKEPDLKAIAVGGNKLSRGLTLEGLLVSYFARSSATYDTLMQMGRWFGFRTGYEELTRIWTTIELAGWFTDLAYVERTLRDDIQVYESMGITPHQLGMRIWQHPTMQVTSYLKRRFATSTTISQSYSNSLVQMFKFPLDNKTNLTSQADANLATVMSFLSNIGKPEWDNQGPIWSKVTEKQVIEFLKKIRQDSSTDRNGYSLPLVCSYIEHQFNVNELTHWTIAIRGQQEDKLGQANWGVPGGTINQISRTRLSSSPISLGAVVSPGDEKIGLNAEELKKFDEYTRDQPNLTANKAARKARSSKEGLILIYPISKYSKPIGKDTRNRQALYDNPSDKDARDLISIAISFPESDKPQPIQAYLVGTSWRPMDE